MAETRSQLIAALDAHPVPFSGLLDLLKNRGFVIGIDHYLRLLAVLRQYGPSCPPERLKTVLCPLFAVDGVQQAQFYRVFDDFMGLAAGEAAQAKKYGERKKQEPAAPESPVRPRTYGLAGTFVLVLVAAVAFRIAPTTTKPAKPKTTIATVAGTGGEALTDNGVVRRRKNLKVVIPMVLAPTPKPTFYDRYGHVLRWTGAAAPVVLILFYRIFLFRRRRFVLERGEVTPPAYAWPIRIAHGRPFFLSTRTFFASAARLRRRVPDDTRRLDVPASVSETVQRAGWPSFAYTESTRPPEYFVLIDEASATDHQARYAGDLVSALKEEGLYVHCRYFSRNPLVSYAAPGAVRERLGDLRARYSNHRLMIIGTGDGFLDPLTGEPEPWLETIAAWPGRVMLTPNPVSRWSVTEARLADIFTVLPATLDGLSAAAAVYTPQGPPSAFTGNHPGGKGTVERPVPMNGDLHELRAYLGDTETFQWFCACAVYPEIHWSLTLHLGLLQKTPVREEQVLRLVRLPWFRTGNLPRELRMRLIEEIDPERLETIRKSIFDLLDADPPPAGTPAGDFYEMHLAVEKAMVSKERRKFLRRIRDAGDRLVHDAAMVRILDEARLSRLSLRLPGWLQKRLFRHGLAVFGIKDRVWAVAAVVAALAVLYVLPAPAVVAPKVLKDLRLEFAHIPAGTFRMGSPENELERSSNETLHQVSLPRDFYMQTTEVNQGQWQAVMGNNPSRFKDCGSDCPVENVSWEDAGEFIRRLNAIDPGRGYRLPTEAQWEYACRAGTRTAFSTGPCLNADQANYNGNYPLGKGHLWLKSIGGKKDAQEELAKPGSCPRGKYIGKTAPAATYPPNPWGLYDMHGNVWEWCADWYGKYGKEVVSVDPKGPEEGENRVLRGGSWVIFAGSCRSAVRSGIEPGVRALNVGFRLVCLQVGQAG